MAAPVHVWLGRSGSGKTSRLIDRLCAHEQKGERAVLVVPEQYTFEAEKALCLRLGGLLQVQVLSFTRLCQRVLLEKGNTLPVIGGPGRRMILKRTALQELKALRVFGRVAESRGFAQRMDEIISRCKQSRITPEDLRRGAEGLMEGSMLKGKLLDIALLYEKSEAFLADRYLTESDLWDRAADALPGSSLAGCHLYVDGIDIPSRQLFYLLRALMKVCASVTVTLRMDPEDPEAELFSPDRATFYRLQGICREEGAAFSWAGCEHTPERPGELLHLERHLFARGEVPYLAAAPALSLRSSATREEEAEQCARQVLSLVKEGYRYADMGIMVTDGPGYVSRIRRAFAQKGIPLFFDSTRPVTGHSAMDFVLCAVRYLESGSMDQVIHMVKSGFAPCTDEAGEIFENYVLRYGLYGSALQKPFTFGEVPPAAEEVRAALAPLLLQLKEGCTRGTTGKEKAEAVYAFMQQARLKDQLLQQGEALIAQGRSNDGELFAQVYTILSGLLSDIAAIWGGDTLSNGAFLALLEEGAASSAMGVLPGMGDTVIVGDFARTRTPAVRVLFVLGGNEGLLPKTHTDDELFSDGELALLLTKDLELWNDTRQQTAMDRLELYTAVGKAQERLYVSFAYSSDGEELAPSPLIKRLKRLFPGCDMQDTGTDTAYPPDKEGSFRQLIGELSLYEKTGYLSADAAAERTYFLQEPGYARRLMDLEEVMENGISPAPLGRQAAEALYGNKAMSASRLEQFNRCPFAHYLKYGLKAREREESGEEAADAGTFLHDALDAFIKEVERRGLCWKQMDEEQADSVVDEILPPLIASHNDGIFLRDKRLGEALFLRIESVKACARSIVRQLQAGRYQPYETELAFGPDCPFPPLVLHSADGESIRLYGRIDRVDVSPEGYYRIIDYKMGDRKFEPAKLAAGLSLQLPLYLAAVEGLGDTPGGMYYMPLSLPAPKEGEERRHVLRGVTAQSDGAIAALEGNLEGKSGIVQGLSRKKDGELSGNACSERELLAMGRGALAVAERTLSDMRGGNVAITPYKDACKWCPYESVCRFDGQQKGCYTRDTKAMKLGDLLRLWEDKA